VSASHFDSVDRLDAFFFVVLDVLHTRYKNDNQYLDALMGETTSAAPRWENFNEHQTEQHLIQLGEVE
jgi:hypothetical protein